MTSTILNIETIVSNPEIRGGRPAIQGTGITVADLVLAHTSGDMLSAEQLALHFKLSLGEVYAALSYYYLHQEAIEESIRRDSTSAHHLLDTLESQDRLNRIE